MLHVCARNFDVLCDDGKCAMDTALNKTSRLDTLMFVWELYSCKRVVRMVGSRVILYYNRQFVACLIKLYRKQMFTSLYTNALTRFVTPL
jgi:hypothetical protein